jgi:hypothetical protein
MINSRIAQRASEENTEAYLPRTYFGEIRNEKSVLMDALVTPHGLEPWTY